MFASAKSRSKKIGREFTLKFEDIVVPEKCPIMDIPLFSVKGGRIPNSPSLDRVDNSKGYTPENSRIISWLANGRKGDLTMEQIDRLHAYVHGEV